MPEPRLKLDHQKIEDFILTHPKVKRLDPKKPGYIEDANRSIAPVLQVSYNTLVKVLQPTEKEGVTQRVAEKIANGMGCSLEDLLTHYYYPDGISSFGLSKIGDRVRAQLDKATELDLKGLPDKARKLCDRLLASPGLHSRERALVVVKKAIYYGNAGQHRLSLGTLQEIFENSPEDNRILEWARFHRALARRRLWELDPKGSDLLDDAESELRQLRRQPHWAAAANHQLGAIHQGRKEFDKALECLEKARNIWQRENNHREGFSRRRIAQIYVAKKKYRWALEHLFAAACIFSRSGARRYADDVNKELKKLLDLIWPPS
jgi:tetratricopeptide (TPR) repeat protein